MISLSLSYFHDFQVPQIINYLQSKYLIGKTPRNRNSVDYIITHALLQSLNFVNYQNLVVVHTTICLHALSFFCVIHLECKISGLKLQLAYTSKPKKSRSMSPTKRRAIQIIAG